MEVAWLNRLLEAQGVETPIKSARIVAAGEDVWLEIVTPKRAERGVLSIFDGHESRVATETRLLPVAGMVFG